MLAATTTPGFVAQPTLVMGRDFNCTTTICYGIGTYHTTFLTLQGFINKFARAAGFAPLAVDGKLGSGTVAAFRKATQWIRAKAGSGSTMKFGSFTPEEMDRPQVAMYALEIIKTLEFWTGTLSAVPSVTTSSPITALTQSAQQNSLPAQVPSPPITSVPAPGTASINLPSSFDPSRPSQGSFGPGVAPAPSSTEVPLWVWIAGGAVVVTAGTMFVIGARRRRTSMAGERLYHLVAINERTGRKTYLTSYPATHHEAVTMKNKFSYHPKRRIQLEEVS